MGNCRASWRPRRNRGAHTASDLFCFEVELPVVCPRGASHRQSDVWFVSFLRRADGMLLRVTPPIPCALDRALDQLQPGFVRSAA
jgi:hypothetical protein